MVPLFVAHSLNHTTIVINYHKSFSKEISKKIKPLKHVKEAMTRLKKQIKGNTRTSNTIQTKYTTR